MNHVLMATFALSLLLAACDATEASPAPSATASKEAPTAASVLDAYEAIRAQLADDSTSELAAKARDLATKARAAATGANGDAKKHLEGLAVASKALAEGASDIDEARKGFGEVSRHVVALVASDAALKKGRHVFECSMAQGYGKWVQTEPDKKNPYMGKKMLACGSESDWSD